MKRLIFPALLVLCGALLAYVLLPAPELPEEVSVGTIVLTPEQIARGRPDGERKGIEKATKAQARPVLRAVAAGAARERILAFTAAATSPDPTVTPDLAPFEAGQLSGDSARPAPAPVAAASLLCYARAEKFDGKRLEHWYDCSDGSERKQIVETGRKFEWIMEGDRADVTYDRATALWDKVKLPLAFVAGGVIGFKLAGL